MFRGKASVQAIDKKASSVTTRWSTNDENMDWLRAGGSGAYTDQLAYDDYNGNSVVGLCVDLIAEKVSKILPVIKNDGNEIIPSHKVLDFLKNPNVMENYSQFIRNIAANYLIGSNAYIEVLGFNKAKPLQMYCLKNTWVAIMPMFNSALYEVNVSPSLFQFLAGTFEMDITDGRIVERTTKLREIYHLKGFSLSLNGFKANPILASVSDEVAMIEQTNTHNLSALEKGFNSPGVLNVDTENESVYERFKKDIRERFSGAGNNQRVIATRGKAVSWAAISNHSNRDMEYMKAKESATNAIFKRFRIPLALMDTKAQTYDNFKAAILSVYDDAVIPLMMEINAVLTEIFRDRGMLSENESIAYDVRSIPATQIRENEQLKMLQSAYIATINEMRTLAGFEEIEGGDVVYLPANLVPVGTDRYTADNIHVSPDTVPTKKRFMEQLEKHHLSVEEREQYWHDYKNILNETLTES